MDQEENFDVLKSIGSMAEVINQDIFKVLDGQIPEEEQDEDQQEYKD